MKPCCEHSEANPYEMTTLPLVTRHDNGALLDALILVEKGAYKQMESLESIAEKIDHSLLYPSLTDKELKAGCALARDFKP